MFETSGPASTKSSSNTNPERTLFVFAHQDDEYFALPWLLEEISSGAAVACAYLTDGGRRSPTSVRDGESRAVLRSAGIREENIVFLETVRGRVPDQELAQRSLDALNALERWILKARFEPVRIYAPSYEGGHPDHDAAHLIAAVIASKRRILTEAWHFSMYNAYCCPRPFFATMHQLPTNEVSRAARRMALGKRWGMALVCWEYRSQRRSWLGLFPGALYARAIARRERVVRFNLDALRRAPHEGELLYERLFATTRSEFEQRTRPLLSLIGLER